MNEKPSTPASIDELLSGETIAAFLDDAFATEDIDKIADALGIAVRAKGVSVIAEQTGLPGERLEASLTKDGYGDLSFTEVVAIVQALGVRLSFEKVGTW
ncbi:addiction module antidote protein (plasmid) [Nitratireductor rhodophyticola]|jgi:probable addiction module antidote protein|uniref:Addiction module antidote protein n=1 Tax=Sphingobium cyanobacteriorum TaxID=3063954 RepID=A0ABT8ZUC6_9SPHN|nr:MULTISPECIES: addiction module antidote protein [Alphaproteobacteria]MDO7837564.1 putative addiction module antidote protein [Sphingobium sp. HBC34]WPZ16212.1 addiction module antidote protein [Nitratireductor rhodophyticola]